jgi:N-acetylmuramoyl-L-alanine amidase
VQAGPPRYDVPALKPIPLTLAACLVAIALGVSALVSGQVPAPAATPLVLLSSAGRRAVPTTVVSDREMVALDDLASAFQLSLRDDPLAGGMTITFKGKTIALMPDQAIASVGGRLVSLPAPVVRSGKRWLVPIEFVDRALALVYDTKLDLRKASHLVVIGDLRVPRLVIRPELQGGQARVTFDTSPKTSNTIVQEPTRLLVRFDADGLDATMPAVATQGLVDTIRFGDQPNTIAIVLGPRFGSFRATLVPTDAASSRIVIDLTAAGAASAPAIPVPPPSTPPAAAPPAAPLEPVPPLPPGIRTIVIDPGHGGSEEGARGASGNLEKDLTLSVARRLKAAIEARLGLRALLTRDGDTAVSLDDRAAFANNNKADLFISLHANASLKKDVRGAEVFYLSPEGYAQAQQAATSTTTLPAFGGGSRDIDLILWEVAQTQHLTQSAVLAGLVEQELRAHVPMSVHPVQQAPFRVLVGANMPAILVEMGFLTNAEQDQALKSNEFQNTIAQALFDAIVRFRDTIERGQPPSTTTPAARPAGLP